MVIGNPHFLSDSFEAIICCQQIEINISIVFSAKTESACQTHKTPASIFFGTDELAKARTYHSADQILGRIRGGGGEGSVRSNPLSLAQLNKTTKKPLPLAPNPLPSSPHKLGISLKEPWIRPRQRYLGWIGEKMGEFVSNFYKSRIFLNFDFN